MTRPDGWTEYRFFKDADERMGAMICGRPRCSRPSFMVSECPELNARVVLCNECYCERHGVDGMAKLILERLDEIGAENDGWVVLEASGARLGDDLMRVHALRKLMQYIVDNPHIA